MIKLGLFEHAWLCIVFRKGSEHPCKIMFKAMVRFCLLEKKAACEVCAMYCDAAASAYIIGV
jgi:hypothetical protein